MTVEIITFGCRLNTYESEVIRDNAKKAGLENTIIFNTCAVTAEAERQARQSIRKIRRQNPEAKIIVTGCSAQMTPDVYANMTEVDQVLGNSEKMEARYFLDTPKEKVIVNDIMAVKETAAHLISGFDGRARAFIQVQNGCDHRCTFCTIPYGRGNSRSVPLGGIIEQTIKLIEAGYQEIVLTGVDITAYGADLPGRPTLGQMIKRLLAQVPSLPRLRISSLDPVEVDEDLFRIYAENSQIMPHLHISLQAGDNMILKRMKRRHLREDAIAFCKKILELRPDTVFGADLIAGFPTETEEMFLNSLKIVEECPLTYLHVFPYSPRPDTPAARMPQVAKNVIKDRAAQLRAAGDIQFQKTMEKFVGTTQQILMENEQFGHSMYFAPTHIDKICEPGALVNVQIYNYTDGKLLGRLV